MNRVRPEIDQLLKEKFYYDSCDEGAAKRYARCRVWELRNKDKRVPALHLSWRQYITFLDLNPEEIRLLIAGGFDVKTGTDAPYVTCLERRFRHRFLVYANGGWCISTVARGDNVNDLIPCAHTTIPTIKLEKPVEMIVGLLDAFRTLKDDLRLHGILPEFIALQEGKDGIFSILAIIEEDARRELVGATEAPAREEAPVGRVIVTR